jgi:hypothetical protein
VYDACFAAARIAGAVGSPHTDREIRATLRSALAGAQRYGPADPPDEMPTTVTDVGAEEFGVSTDDDETEDDMTDDGQRQTDSDADPNRDFDADQDDSDAESAQSGPTGKTYTRDSSEEGVRERGHPFRAWSPVLARTFVAGMGRADNEARPTIPVRQSK